MVEMSAILCLANQSQTFTQSDFDKAIADLEAQIAELKAKYPEFAKLKNKEITTPLNSPEKPVMFKGVSKHTSCNRWQSQCCVGHKNIYLGIFPTPEEAAWAYDLKIVELRGEGCTTNFPVEGIKTNVLFPDYPATKNPLILEQKQLELQTESIEANPNETIFDRMRAFAIANGIEIKTMKVTQYFHLENGENLL